MPSEYHRLEKGWRRGAGEAREVGKRDPVCLLCTCMTMQKHVSLSVFSCHYDCYRQSSALRAFLYRFAASPIPYRYPAPRTRPFRLLLVDSSRHLLFSTICSRSASLYTRIGTIAVSLPPTTVVARLLFPANRQPGWST